MDLFLICMYIFAMVQQASIVTPVDTLKIEVKQKVTVLLQDIENQMFEINIHFDQFSNVYETIWPEQKATTSHCDWRMHSENLHYTCKQTPHFVSVFDMIKSVDVGSNIVVSRLGYWNFLAVEKEKKMIKANIITGSFQAVHPLFSDQKPRRKVLSFGTIDTLYGDVADKFYLKVTGCNTCENIVERIKTLSSRILIIVAHGYHKTKRIVKIFIYSYSQMCTYFGLLTSVCYSRLRSSLKLEKIIHCSARDIFKQIYVKLPNRTNKSSKDSTCSLHIYNLYLRYVRERKCELTEYLINKSLRSLSNELCSRLCLILVFSIVFMCVTGRVKVGCQKEWYSHQEMPKTKSVSHKKEDELFQKCPSFIFKVRIFQHRTLKTFPYGGTYGIDMSNYLHRLGTFKHNSHIIKLRPHELASDGFYALDNPGHTKCYSCGFVYSEWKSGDDPRKIHLQNSPSCPFIKHHIELLDGRKNTGADRMSPKDNGLKLNEEGNRYSKQDAEHSADGSKTGVNKNAECGLESSDKSYKYREPDVTSSIQDASDQPRCNGKLSSIPSTDQYPSGVTHISRFRGTEKRTERQGNISRQSSYNTREHRWRYDRPRFPNYAVLTVRVSSFQGFPCYVSQSPRQLALAGFFYVGYGDGVQCYFCGGKLTNWEPDDDPFVEHAKWFPMCLFLRETKGEEFILLVRETYGNENLQLEEFQKREKSYSDHTVRDHDSLHENTKDTNMDRNHVPQRGHHGEIERKSTLATSPLSNGSSVTERSKYSESFVQSADTVSISLSRTPDHSMTDLVSQMDQTSIDENSKKDSKIPSESESRSLLDEYRRLRDQRLCKVCLDQDSSIAFLPCGHLVCCPQCAPAIRKCPICRQLVKGSIKTWLG